MNIKQNFGQESIVICDNKTWVWDYITKSLSTINEKHIKLPSSISLSSSWSRISQAKRIILFWENEHRPSGSIIEEIIDISPIFDISEKIIILTTNPMKEDVIYLSELDIDQIIKLSLKTLHSDRSESKLINFMKDRKLHNNPGKNWTKINRTLKSLPPKPPMEMLLKITETVENLFRQENMKHKAAYYDTTAQIANLMGNTTKAINLWQKSLEVNPNYFRAYNNLIDFYVNTNPQKALQLLQKMHLINRKKTSRMAKMGEAYLKLRSERKAEYWFEQALENNHNCNRSLNGLAEIRFRQGDLNRVRALLARSTKSTYFATKLNQLGVHLVKIGEYEKALEHYSKAQFVLPQQEKSPMLFYNMGLCYSKWGKPLKAVEFLKLALIKDPNYQKVQRLLTKIQEKP